MQFLMYEQGKKKEGEIRMIYHKWSIQIIHIHIVLY